MAWDPGPWAVAGGSVSADTARQLAYTAMQGSEGIIGPDSLRVEALDVPGAQVRVLPGACGILNRTPGYSMEAYTARNPTLDSVDIAATGSAGGRSDLIVARVEDPTLSGSPWEPPADPVNGQYVWSRVISNVPAGTETVAELGLGYSAIALARLDIPANTSTITQDMITDLRVVANPRNRFRQLGYSLVSGEEDVLTATGEDGEYFPSIVGRWDVRVPEWATRVFIIATWGSVLQPPGNNVGVLWVQIGDNGSTYKYKTQNTRYDTMSLSTNTRVTYVVADDKNVKPEIRGQVVRFGMRGRMDRNISGGDSNIRLNWGSSIALQLQFVEEPDVEHAP